MQAFFDCAFHVVLMYIHCTINSLFLSGPLEKKTWHLTCQDLKPKKKVSNSFRSPLLGLLLNCVKA